MATRESIEQTLRTLNEVENSEASAPAAKSAAIDELMVADVRGWLNGASRGDRNAERESEAFLFAALPDYHRDFDHVLIDPPQAAVTWTMRGTVTAGQPLPAGTHFELKGASVWRFDDDGRIEEFWMFFHDPLAGREGPA